ncbi:hypothetical protein K491DRAFT_675006 [Lophiostoma macrostomum CBS 122681]|uniref:Uncharacterized protein n=1 Tax=Lophiostoma macrostomum CBS 122681 TaxID=1314788 RepID=A0A6A6TM08_9PLEO|nr:hypothetical protein K491DRAFT_675006 [Lophiostoma macrostomum CBS 122681]
MLDRALDPALDPNLQRVDAPNHAPGIGIFIPIAFALFVIVFWTLYAVFIRPGRKERRRIKFLEEFQMQHSEWLCDRVAEAERGDGGVWEIWQRGGRLHMVPARVESGMMDEGLGRG